MKSVKMLVAHSVAVAGLALALPAVAQSPSPAGVVTNLQGTANLQRVSTTQPAPQLLPLKFRDELLVQDRITTGDQSLVRILLGGKAVVTVREHSSLTITDTQTTSTINMSVGKIALAVLKDRMKPGESIEIKTPNAVAGVRGTVLIAEVTQATAQAGTPAGGVTSRFTLLTGIVDVSLLDPTTGRPGASRFTLNPLQTLGITGFTPPAGPRNITPAQAQAAANDYKVNLKDAPQASNAQITDRQVEQAANAAAATTGGLNTTQQLINNTVTGGTTTKPTVRPEDGAARSAATTPVNNGGKDPGCTSICEGSRAFRR
jgi:FecR protein